MNFFLLFLALLPFSEAGYDRQCANDLANLWLDVVVVIDQSMGMTKENVEKASSTISEVFNTQARFGDNHADPRNTRIGLVTYGRTAQVVSNLNTIYSYADLYGMFFRHPIPLTDNNDSYLAVGLQAAQVVLSAGRTSNVRSNYKQVVILMTNQHAGSGDLEPIVAAEKLKSKDIRLIVVDYFANLQSLKNLASRDMYVNYEKNGVQNVQFALTRANCYCPTGWTRYIKDGTENSGVCLLVSKTTSNWKNAKIACNQLIKNGYLATEYTQEKHNFIEALVAASTGMTSNYHIGLIMVRGSWYWEQPMGANLEPLTSPNQEVLLWGPGYPKDASTNLGVANVKGTDSRNGWQNINADNDVKHYVCETLACDSSNYCS